MHTVGHTSRADLCADHAFGVSRLWPYNSGVIITDDFVMLNFPKTGSSFAREVIRRLYRQRESRLQRALTAVGWRRPAVLDLKVPKIDEALDYAIRDQHGSWRQIPPAHRHKPVLSITRNPFSRYVSTYLFRWWEKHPPVSRSEIERLYPHFPDLSFAEYMAMMHTYGRQNRLRGITPPSDLGLHTIQFIQFYFREPESVLAQLDAAYLERQQYRQDMPPIHFIHQEQLSSELQEALQALGFAESELRFISTLGRINVTASTTPAPDFWAFYADAELREQVLQRERLLFLLFPTYLPEASAS